MYTPTVIRAWDLPLRRVMWVDLRYGQASTQQRMCRYGGRGAGQQAPERVGAVPGQFQRDLGQ